MICQTLCYLCWKLYQWHVKITKFICRLPEKKFREDGGGEGGEYIWKVFIVLGGYTCPEVVEVHGSVLFLWHQ